MSNALQKRKVTALALLALVALPAAAGAQTCKDDIVRTAPDTRFADNADGTVTDLDTGLIWKRCSEGQTYDPASSGCHGIAEDYTWQQALQRVESVNSGAAGESLGRTDWRLPNIKELASLVEHACYDPAINLTAFPSTPWPYEYVSATYSAGVLHEDFHEGESRFRSIYFDEYVRLVRGGQ